jgi:hypothetical protein
MRERITRAIVTLISLITFLVVGASIVWDFQAWECQCSHTECEWCADDWSAFHADAFAEYADEFTALFDSYETKWSKNNRLMIRVGDTGSYRFAKKN